MWKPGDTAVWRGIFRNRIWHAVPSFGVKDSLQELVLTVMPGTTCMVEENYAKSHKNGKRRWKDEEDYQKAIEQGVIVSEWVQGIERAKPEIFERLEKRQYPFDSFWLNWKPDPTCSPPTLPENWDKI